MPNLSEAHRPQLPSVEHQRIESQIADVRNQISDLGSELDTFKAKKAGAMGGGVFLLLLALIAAYDLLNGKSNLWLAVGISGQLLKVIAIGLALTALSLFSLAAYLEKTRDRSREAKLTALQDELETLLLRQSTLETT